MTFTLAYNINNMLLTQLQCFASVDNGEINTSDESDGLKSAFPFA